MRLSWKLTILIQWWNFHPPPSVPVCCVFLILDIYTLYSRGFCSFLIFPSSLCIRLQYCGWWTNCRVTPIKYYIFGCINKLKSSNSLRTECQSVSHAIRTDNWWVRLKNIKHKTFQIFIIPSSESFHFIFPRLTPERYFPSRSISGVVHSDEIPGSESHWCWGPGMMADLITWYLMEFSSVGIEIETSL